MRSQDEGNSINGRFTATVCSLFIGASDSMKSLRNNLQGVHYAIAVLLRIFPGIMQADVWPSRQS